MSDSWTLGWQPMLIPSVYPGIFNGPDQTTSVNRSRSTRSLLTERLDDLGTRNIALYYGSSMTIYAPTFFPSLARVATMAYNEENAVCAAQSHCPLMPHASDRP